jgi:hypothetical protein
MLTSAERSSQIPKADISFPSSCGINRRIHHPTANSRLDDPESPVNTSRLPVTNPANFL